MVVMVTFVPAINEIVDVVMPAKSFTTPFVLKIFQSVEERYPFVDPSAFVMESVFPEKDIGVDAELILFA